MKGVKLCWLEDKNQCAKNYVQTYVGVDEAEELEVDGECRHLSSLDPAKTFKGDKKAFCTEMTKRNLEIDIGQLEAAHRAAPGDKDKRRALMLLKSRHQTGGSRKKRRGKKNNKKHTRVRRGGACGGSCCGGGR